MSKIRSPKTFAWQFALVNNRLAEIYFNNSKILGHCYLGTGEHKTKREKKWIIDDTRKMKLSYYRGRYRKK